MKYSVFFDNFDFPESFNKDVFFDNFNNFIENLLNSDDLLSNIENEYIGLSYFCSIVFKNVIGSIPSCCGGGEDNIHWCYYYNYTGKLNFCLEKSFTVDLILNTLLYIIDSIKNSGYEKSLDRLRRDICTQNKTLLLTIKRRLMNKEICI